MTTVKVARDLHSVWPKRIDVYWTGRVGTANHVFKTKRHADTFHWSEREQGYSAGSLKIHNRGQLWTAYWENPSDAFDFEILGRFETLKLAAKAAVGKMGSYTSARCVFHGSIDDNPPYLDSKESKSYDYYPG